MQKHKRRKALDLHTIISGRWDTPAYFFYAFTKPIVSQFTH